jgi:acetyl esterase/lipase
MASEQSEAVRALWTSWMEAARANPNETPDDLRARVEHLGDLTAEPDGVDNVEIEVAGLPALWAIPKGSAGDRVVLSFHGGGFVSGSIHTHRKLFGHLAKAIGARALITDYRGTPMHSHPVPLEDTTAAYRWVLEQGIDAKHVAVAGDSSGGGLAISTMLLPTAAALMLMSPWVDMTVSAETYESNRETEPFFYREVVGGLATRFLAGGDPKDPLASPLYADLRGVPPMYIEVGGVETLLDDSRQLERRALDAGVEVRLDVFPEQVHTFQMGAGRAPEADDAIRRFADWVRPRLGLSGGDDHIRHASVLHPAQLNDVIDPRGGTR